MALQKNAIERQLWDDCYTLYADHANREDLMQSLQDWHDKTIKLEKKYENTSVADESVKLLMAVGEMLQCHIWNRLEAERQHAY